MKQPRVRKWAKWVCTLAAVWVALAWAASERWYLNWADTPINQTTFFACRGCIALSRDTSINDFDLTLKPAGWSHGRTDHLIIRPRERWLPAASIDAQGFSAAVPFWLPLLIAAAAAGFLWRSETMTLRRRSLGLCRGCAYDRRGLSADAKCPECGSVSGPASK